MGVSRTLFTGVTGLSVNSDGMGVTANNIANANAKGFKRDRAEFEDLLSTDLNSGAGVAQIGRGARLRDVRTLFTQGGLKVTDNLTDLAIQGTGFFVVSAPNADAQKSAGKFYTRTGSMSFDKDGYLVSSNGGRVQGYIADDNGHLKTEITDVKIRTSSIPPKATNKVVMNVNLDAKTEPNPDVEFNIADAEGTSDFNNTVTIFDSQGRPHSATIYYKRLDTDEGIQWDWHATVDSKEVVDPDDDADKKLFANGKISFDNNGNLLREEQEDIGINFKGGAFQNQVMEFDFGQNLEEEGGEGINASTSIAANSDTIFHSQNGHESGNLKSMRIDLDGKITGIFTNGLRKTLGGVGIATFQSQNGLEKVGRNEFVQTIDSGPPSIGLPRTGTRGSIYASSLEESNVDLATEFVNMIMQQRLFQANSRSITTADTMIEETVNLKR